MEEKSKKRIIPSAYDLLEKTRKVIDPNGEFEDIKTLQITMKQTEIIEDSFSRTSTSYRFIYQKENPEVYDLYLKITKSLYEKKIVDIINTFICNGEVTVTDNGKEIKSNDSTEKSFINKQIERTEEFKSMLTFGLFEPQLSERVSNTIYNIDENECYKMEVVLDNRFIDHSDKLALYIDCQNYHIRKIETDFYVINNIVYKKFGGINFIHRCKFDDNFDNEKAKYYIIEKFEVNKPITDILLNSKLLKGKSI